MQTTPAFFAPPTVLVALWLGLAEPPTLSRTAPGPGIGTVPVSAEGKTFVTGASSQLLRIWGVNYNRDDTAENGRLLEDYWHTERGTGHEDFGEMKVLGADVVCIHLQLVRFMSAPATPVEASLDQLRRLLDLAGSMGLYLNITGLPGWGISKGRRLS